MACLIISAAMSYFIAAEYFQKKEERNKYEKAVLIVSFFLNVALFVASVTGYVKFVL